MTQHLVLHLTPGVKNELWEEGRDECQQIPRLAWRVSSPSPRAACIMTARLTVLAGTAVLGFPLCNHFCPVCRNISLQSNITLDENVLSFITIF